MNLSLDISLTYQPLFQEIQNLNTITITTYFISNKLYRKLIKSHAKYYDQTVNELDLHVGDKVLIKEQNKKTLKGLSCLDHWKL